MTLSPEFKDFAEARDRGLTPSEVVKLMHQRGLTIAKAVMGYAQLYQVDLMEADEAVGSNLVYRHAWEASKRMRGDLSGLIDRISERLQKYREKRR
jgi:hypothetical protein